MVKRGALIEDGRYLHLEVLKKAANERPYYKYCGVSNARPKSLGRDEVLDEVITHYAYAGVYVSTSFNALYSGRGPPDGTSNSVFIVHLIIYFQRGFNLQNWYKLPEFRCRVKPWRT